MNTTLKIFDAVIGFSLGNLLSSLCFTGSDSWHISLPVALIAMHMRMILTTQR